ncbi:hypothetical protein Tco_1113542 [Tanacetum coccineum]|uniref:Uncharacterized protein n=1 Tax=Tanacetum coccineum TaxID=301880 RepID=A0ABQ5ISL0_9ASTR
MESSELRDMDFSEVPTVRLLLANTLADGTLELQATMIPLSIQSPEASIRTISLQLANASGITMLPNNEIFEGMGQMGNMKRGFRGAPRPLLPAMLLVATSNLNVEQSPPPIPTLIPAFTPTPIPETDPDPMEHTFEEPSPVHQHSSPPQEHAQGQMTLDDLLQVVPQLMTKIDSLEKDLKQTKLTMGSAIVKLVKKVKKMEDILKRRNVVLSDSEEEEYEAQRRKSQDNPLVSLVQGLVTPSKTTVQTSGENLQRKMNYNCVQQKKRRAQVQFEAQHYTDEDCDLIRAKIEANAELSKSVLGSDLQGEYFAKKMVELVNQRKKHFVEENARAKRNKPMTQSQLRTYMMNYLKNQGTWKLSQLKNFSFEEVKEEFDKLVKHVESFAPINFEATKDSLKRFGEELQTKTSKRLKSDEAKDDVPTKKTRKRRKQMARKGLHTDLDKDDSEDLDEASK